MDETSRSIHNSSIIVDCLEISNWGEEVFQSMRSGGLTAVNCTISILDGFRETINNVAWWHAAFEIHEVALAVARQPRPQLFGVGLQCLCQGHGLPGVRL